MELKTLARAVTLGLLAISCAQVPSTPSPSARATIEGSAGLVSSAADGDVKTGNGALEIIRLRMDRQTASGVSILRQYALPGVTYAMEAGETIELWPEWDPNLNFVPTVIPQNPRLTVDWGAGEPDSPSDINCGSCLLRHKYKVPGVYRVVVTLNDRSGTSVSRTFFLNSLDPAPCIAPTLLGSPASNICDNDGTYEAAELFVGAGLTYSLVEVSCQGSAGVSRAAAADGISIDPVTGVITSTLESACIEVTATNACGSVTHSLLYRPYCD